MPRTRATQDPDVIEKPSMNKQAALSSMRKTVIDLFEDAQKADSLPRGNAIHLRDIQIGCCYNSPRLIGQPEDIDFEGEASFLKFVFKAVNMVIKAKRKEPAADRVQRFIAGFLQYIQSKDDEAKKRAREKRKELQNNSSANAGDVNAMDQDNENENGNESETENEKESKSESESERESEDESKDTENTKDDDEYKEDKEEESDTNTNTNTNTLDKDKEEKEKEEEDEDDDEDDMDNYETVTSRFVNSLLRHLFRGFSDVKVSLRIRCCQMIALSISSMGELDEDLYQDLKKHLFDAHVDKEAGVRVQAVTALCRLQSDNEVNPADGQTIHDKLMWSLRRDPSAEVRRVALFNIDVTSETLPYIIESIRDTDDVNRRVVYLKPLSYLPDFRMLSTEERRQVLKWGLNDRNELVRRAALKMFAEAWIQHADNNLVEFLERMEATNPLISEHMEKLLESFFKDRSDILAGIVFDEEFWLNLTGESALLAKVLIRLLQSQDDSDERLDTILPEVIRHVQNLENYYNLFRYRDLTDDNAFNYEFIVTQLLDISLCLDYADETGRRKMFELLRNLLRSHELTQEHLERVMKIFRIISINERDFTRSIVEIISDIQEEAAVPFLDSEDTVTLKRAKLDGSQPSADTQSSKGSTLPDSQATTGEADSLAIKFRCLNICKKMLENSYEPLPDNSILYGLLNDLIVPTVQNPDTQLRQEGLHCLGLCCTLDKRLAQHNVALFITCIKHGHEEIVKKAVKTLGDILLMYGVEAMSEHLPGSEDIKETFEFGLDHDDTEIQSLTTQSLCKLLLFNRFSNDELLRLMILLYFFPRTETDEASNAIHQCLAYFFPAYSFSSIEHQESLSNVTIPALEELCNVYGELEKDETMANPKQISEMLADWNDPRKLNRARAHNPNYQFDDEIDDAGFDKPGKLAIKALQIVLKEEEGMLRKTMCSFISKLYLDKADKADLAEIKTLIETINTENPIRLHPTRKILTKISELADKVVASADS